jgi:hypothetical protein
MNLNFQRGDIVLSAPGFSPACYCILEVTPFRPSHPYTGLNLVNLKLYRLAGNGLTRIGAATDEFLMVHATEGSSGQSGTAQDLRYKRGQMRAAREAWDSTGDEQKRWLILASAKPGDAIHVRHECGHGTPFRFRCVIERGSKYVFVAEDGQGIATKFSLGVVSLDQPAVKLLQTADLSALGAP